MIVNKRYLVQFKMDEKVEQLTEKLNQLTAVESAFFNSIQDKNSLSASQLITINNLHEKYCGPHSPRGNMQNKIYQLLKKKDQLLKVELAFITHVQNKQYFSPPEEKTINNLYHKYCENGWLRSYDKKKRRIMKSCAEFWVNNPPRFSELAAQVLNDPDFVPTKDQYKEMCDNREARNFLHPEEAKPLYPAGSLVKIKRDTKTPWGVEGCRGKLGVVIRVRRNEQIYPSNDSNFLYHILPQGSAEMLLFVEKDIKLVEADK